MTLPEWTSQQTIIFLLTVIGMFVGIYHIMTFKGPHDPEHEAYIREKERVKSQTNRMKDDDAAANS